MSKDGTILVSGGKSRSVWPNNFINGVTGHDGIKLSDINTNREIIKSCPVSPGDDTCGLVSCLLWFSTQNDPCEMLVVRMGLGYLIL